MYIHIYLYPLCGAMQPYGSLHLDSNLLDADDFLSFVAQFPWLSFHFFLSFSLVLHSCIYKRYIMSPHETVFNSVATSSHGKKKENGQESKFPGDSQQNGVLRGYPGSS